MQSRVGIPSIFWNDKKFEWVAEKKFLLIFMNAVVRPTLTTAETAAVRGDARYYHQPLLCIIYELGHHALFMNEGRAWSGVVEATYSLQTWLCAFNWMYSSCAYSSALLHRFEVGGRYGCMLLCTACAIMISYDRIVPSDVCWFYKKILELRTREMWHWQEVYARHSECVKCISLWFIVYWQHEGTHNSSGLCSQLLTA